MARSNRSATRPLTFGLTHLALGVRDVERAFTFYQTVFGMVAVYRGDQFIQARRVRAAGGEITEQGEFVPGEPYLFARDPDGCLVEIWYEIPTTTDP